MVSTTQKNGYVLANFAALIDGLTDDSFREAARPIIDQGNADLFLDFSNTEYINSDGLARIIELHKAAKQRSKLVVLISPTPFVRKVLKTTNLDSIFTIANSLDDAIATTQMGNLD